MKKPLTDGFGRVQAVTGDVDMTPATCDTALMETLIKHGERRLLSAGELLCAYGDTARHLWLMLEGRIAATAPDLSEDVLHGHPKSLCLIGEAAFFTDQKRNASLRCVTDVEVVELDFDLVRELRKTAPGLKAAMERLFRERLVDRLLSSHDVFKFINAVDRKRIALAFTSRYAPAGQVLIDFDEEHDGAYMVQSGVLQLVEADGGKDQCLIRELHIGDMVHLGGLLRGYRASYRVATATPVDLLHLPRKCFEPFAQRRPWAVQAILQSSRFAVHRKTLKAVDRVDVWTLEQALPYTDGGQIAD
ncbi:MAG: cyclic nucleotide-binding domain-containing protein [Mariprofundaceae bacterium]